MSTVAMKTDLLHEKLNLGDTDVCCIIKISMNMVSNRVRNCLSLFLFLYFSYSLVVNMKLIHFLLLFWSLFTGIDLSEYDPNSLYRDKLPQPCFWDGQIHLLQVTDLYMNFMDFLM